MKRVRLEYWRYYYGASLSKRGQRLEGIISPLLQGLGAVSYCLCGTRVGGGSEVLCVPDG